MSDSRSIALPATEALDAMDMASLTRTYRSCLEHQLAVRESGLDDAVSTYRGQPLAFMMNGLTGPDNKKQLRGATWKTWRTVLKAAYGYPLDDLELATFKEVAGGREPPPGRVKELWLFVGRRGGKDSIASLIAAEMACYASDGVALRPGERVLIPCFACDRTQAQIIYNYTKAYFEGYQLSVHVLGELPASAKPIELDNDVVLAIATNNFRAPRGWPIGGAIFDETCFWRSEESATPDVETYTAVISGMGTVPKSMLVSITTVYRKKGLAYDKFKEYYGVNDPYTLVIVGDTLTFNPGFDETVVRRATDADPERAHAEYNSVWRSDLADYVQREVAEAAVVQGRAAVAPVQGAQYYAFADPSGGSSDSMTLAIAHREGDRGVLDCLLERRAPFQPSDVVAEHATTLQLYGINRIKGDRYAGNWPSEAYAKVGIAYDASERTKSDIYRDFLPFLNSGRIELLDLKRLVYQLCRLERRTVRGGRDSIDHPLTKGQQVEHDDLINAAAGALLEVIGEVDPVTAMLRAAGM